MHTSSSRSLPIPVFSPFPFPPLRSLPGSAPLIYGFYGRRYLHGKRFPLFPVRIPGPHPAGLRHSRCRGNAPGCPAGARCPQVRLELPRNKEGRAENSQTAAAALLQGRGTNPGGKCRVWGVAAELKVPQKCSVFPKAGLGVTGRGFCTCTPKHPGVPKTPVGSSIPENPWNLHRGAPGAAAPLPPHSPALPHSQPGMSGNR